MVNPPKLERISLTACGLYISYLYIEILFVVYIKFVWVAKISVHIDEF